MLQEIWTAGQVDSDIQPTQESIICVKFTSLTVVSSAEAIRYCVSCVRSRPRVVSQLICN